MDTIIYVADGTVSKDGETFKVAMSELPKNVHVIRWDGVKGTIEWAADDDGRKLPNTEFSNFTPFEYLVGRWMVKREAEIQRKKEEKEEQDRVKAERESKKDQKVM